MENRNKSGVHLFHTKFKSYRASLFLLSPRWKLIEVVKNLSNFHPQKCPSRLLEHQILCYKSVTVNNGVDYLHS